MRTHSVIIGFTFTVLMFLLVESQTFAIGCRRFAGAALIAFWY